MLWTSGTKIAHELTFRDELCILGFLFIKREAFMKVENCKALFSSVGWTFFLNVYFCWTWKSFILMSYLWFSGCDCVGWGRSKYRMWGNQQRMFCLVISSTEFERCNNVAFLSWCWLYTWFVSWGLFSKGFLMVCNSYSG